MKKVAIVYWSGTGNTEAMAEAVKKGAEEAGAEVEVVAPADFHDVSAYDSVGFGCPAMGAEQLEEGEFQPMFDEVKPSLAGKRIALFGSYGWGDGEWMRTWESDCDAVGAIRVADSVIANNEPDDDTINECVALGKALAA